MAKLALSSLGDTPSVLTDVQLRLPLPSVFKTCPVVPSEVGNVNALATVKLLLLLIFNAGVVLELLPV